MGRLIFILLLVLIHIFFGNAWLLDSPYILRALGYSFFHANWWHLAINSIAIWSIYKSCKPCRDLVFPFFIAVLVYPLSFRPVIGISNVLYATLGCRTPSLKSPWWKQPSVIVFLVVTVALVFIPRFSATTHIAAFVSGMGVAALQRTYNSLIHDAGRYL